MKAIILAAGKARRLYPITKDLPKCLLKIGDETILDKQIKILNFYGVKDIIVVTGHFHQKIKSNYNKHVKCIYNPYFPSTFDVVSLWCARKEMKDDFIFLHGDVLFQKELLENLLEQEGDIVLSVEKKKCDEEDEKVLLKENQIIRIGKEIHLGEADGEFIGMGKVQGNSRTRYVEALNSIINQGRLEDQCTEIIQYLIDNNLSVCASMIGNEKWMEVDFAEDLELAQKRSHLFGI